MNTPGDPAFRPSDLLPAETPAAAAESTEDNEAFFTTYDKDRRTPRSNSGPEGLKLRVRLSPWGPREVL